MNNHSLRVVWSDAAQDDLDRIFDYLVHLNPAVAADVVTELLVAGDSLGTFPDRGRKGRIPTTRELVAVQPYVVIYEIADGGVTILRIWHAAQDRR